MAAFERAYMTSYSTLIVAMRLSVTVALLPFGFSVIVNTIGLRCYKVKGASHVAWYREKESSRVNSA